MNRHRSVGTCPPYAFYYVTVPLGACFIDLKAVGYCRMMGEGGAICGGTEGGTSISFEGGRGGFVK